ncbi:MAG: hypothetical protein J6D45_01410 [Clostridia bacterium]|nr:hypothetical protein [Clostridia bacterium]
MKRFCLIMITLMMILALCSCNSESNNKDNFDSTEKTYMTTPCSKEDVDAFCDIIGELQGEGLLSGLVLDKGKCFNVTPQEVALETNYKIFKFSDSCASFVMIDNEVYTLCEWFGGYGFVNAVPCDFDNDGNKDLLVASSWGSGLHRSIISIFNSVTKESTVIYDTSTTDNPQINLFVAAVSPSFSSKDPSDSSIYYQVYSAEIKSNDNNLANLSYVATGIIGSISTENGVIAFIPTEKS